MKLVPKRPRFNPKDDLHYDDARLAWRRSLSDEDVRAMAADYARGDREPPAVDAWAEYEHRFGTHSKHVNGEKKNKKPSKGRKGRST